MFDNGQSQRVATYPYVLDAPMALGRMPAILARTGEREAGWPLIYPETIVRPEAS